MQKFSHSGDIGDIIYALPAIRAQGGGELYLFDMPGRTAHGMTEAKVNRLRPLLELQPYITAVHWSPSIADSSLNGFRDHLGHAGTLTDAHLATQAWGWEARRTAWLEVDVPHCPYPVVFSRSPRYRNNRFPWHMIADTYRGQACFVGFPDEHEDFVRRYGEVPLYRADDFLELARAIAGSKLFVGNQSSPLAVAHGLKHPLIMEISPGAAQHHCVFQRWNCIIGWDEKIELPDINQL